MTPPELSPKLRATLWGGGAIPLANDKDKFWSGWLVDGLGGREAEVLDSLLAALDARNIPKASIRHGNVNMWWRRDSLFIDVTSSMDGQITTTIHVQEYGTSLWVGRAAESYKQTNYYKRMAAAAFLETVDRCIRDTLIEAAGEPAVHNVTEAA